MYTNNVDNMYRPIAKEKELAAMYKPLPMEVDTSSTRASTSDKKEMVPIDKTKGKGKGGPKANSKKKNNSRNKKEPACGWCNGKHNLWTCKTQGDGKWVDKICNQCNGRGHPKAVCPSLKR